MTSPVKLVGKIRFQAFTGYLDSANSPGNEAGHFLPYSSPSIWVFYISKVTRNEQWVISKSWKANAGLQAVFISDCCYICLTTHDDFVSNCKKVRKIHVIYWLFRTRAVAKYAKMLNLSLWGCSARCNENVDFPWKEHPEVNHFFLSRWCHPITSYSGTSPLGHLHTGDTKSKAEKSSHNLCICYL